MLIFSDNIFMRRRFKILGGNFPPKRSSEPEGVILVTSLLNPSYCYRAQAINFNHYNISIQLINCSAKTTNSWRDFGVQFKSLFPYFPHSYMILDCLVRFQTSSAHTVSITMSIYHMRRRLCAWLQTTSAALISMTSMKSKYQYQ